MTLWELMIVLVILLALLGAAWPRLRAVMHKAALERAAKNLHAALSQGRLDAIESGVPRQFRFQPGGKNFAVSPLIAAVDDTSQLTDATTDASAPSGTAAADTAGRFELPGGVLFSLLQTANSAALKDADDSGEQIKPDDFGTSGGSSSGGSGTSGGSGSSSDSGTSPDSAAPDDSTPPPPPTPDVVSDADWSEPVLLFPNGRSSNATIRLYGADNMYINVTLRGVVGVARVGQVQLINTEAAP